MFGWPEGRQCAVSLTFDDGRPSQVDNALPVLDRYGVKATFYVMASRIADRLEGWRRAVAGGHEMGNHTQTHPCTGNFPWSRANALEAYTLERMEADIDAADAAIQAALGVRPATFAYPCGQKYVGRSETALSYVPLIARRFSAGRGFRDEAVNEPLVCDLAQALGVDADGAPMEGYLLEWLAEAREMGGWLILAAHDVGVYPRQAMATEVLDELCRYCASPANGIWTAPVAAVAAHIRQCTGNPRP